MISNQKSKNTKNFFADLICPICSSKLLINSNTLICVNVECNASFPMINEIPVIINETTSLFSSQEIISSFTNSYLKNSNPLKEFFKILLPEISANYKAKQNFELLLNLLLEKTSSPNILIIGGAEKGVGSELLFENPEVNILESDVKFSNRTQIIFDCNNIPFPDGYFDCVVIQAVVDDLIEPIKCVNEIHRVLKSSGLIYAEIPFMQQVHSGCYDFQRYTLLGIRKLFSTFKELESGSVCGPGMALAWSYNYFLTSFSSSKIIKKVLNIFARYTSFYLKYFDKLLIKNISNTDAASGLYFLGEKSSSKITDKEILLLYKGSH